MKTTIKYALAMGSVALGGFLVANGCHNLYEILSQPNYAQTNLTEFGKSVGSGLAYLAEASGGLVSALGGASWLHVRFHSRSSKKRPSEESDLERELEKSDGTVRDDTQCILDHYADENKEKEGEKVFGIKKDYLIPFYGNIRAIMDASKGGMKAKDLIELTAIKYASYGLVAYSFASHQLSLSIAGVFGCFVAHIISSNEKHEISNPEMYNIRPNDRKEG